MVRSGMSPSGIGYDRRSNLMVVDAAALDAVQLPGRCHTGQDNDPATMIAEAIHDLAEDRCGEWAIKGPRRDVQWKANNRTPSLKKTVTSQHEALQECLTELQDLKGDTYENQVHAFRAILSDLPCWSDALILACVGPTKLVPTP
jgi:hypothetical protein